MKSIPACFFAAGALCGLGGMLWGIQMSASHDHMLSPAHGHLQLLGFVAMTVFGSYYALTPRAAETRMAVLHLAASLLAVALLIPGIALAILDRGELLAQAGSLAAVLSMLTFLSAILRYGVGSPVGGRQHRRPLHGEPVA
ncbi:cbb3-type cytochrome c oxidase subunit I [Poseidonocella sp. HB161398]|uniref:cbb3-type cytochrome c oxidase subunit I n=1 Tax=Poseidonocella sp. HB161398 TaxID=2320855 RepID=UPI001F10C885|nr:cbb3-type cytochrome c oxidase subunit I [Poseidonocella sp. HB161398]